MPFKVRVISPHEASYKVPLVAHEGDELVLGQRDYEWPGWIWGSHPGSGIGGWVPEAYLESWGSSARVLRDYTGRELSVVVGDVLTAEYDESGWLWCRSAQGESGWVPEKNVTPIS